MNRYTSISLAAAALLLALLQGCSTSPKPATEGRQPDSTPTTERQLSEIEQLLLQAETSTPLAKAEYTLQAAERLAELEQLERSRQLLNEINPFGLPEPLQMRLWLLDAELNQAAGLSEIARTSLDRITTPETLPAELYERWNTLQLQLLDLLPSDPTASLMALISRSETASADQQAQLNKRIWQTMQQLEDNQVDTLATQPGNSYLQQGWLELGLLARRQGLDILAQSEALGDWLNLWNLHPAAIYLPDELETLRQNQPRAARHIAILLPQSGPLAKPARAIIEGILAAHYQRLQQDHPVPQITLFDSAQVDDLTAFYSQAHDQGIDRILGPLDKAKLDRLVQQASLDIPTLALNYADSGSATIDLFQFGLRGEDEARQAARRAWADGHRVAVSLTPDTSWGKRILTAFIEEWSRLGGLIAAQQEFSGENDFSDKVSRLLAVDRSKQRAKQLLNLVTEKFEFEPRRREDIDFLFLSALAKDARQIKPIMAFHYAAALPVYATSHIYSGTPRPLKDQDLNGIEFSDIPWVLEQDSPLRSQLQQHRDNTRSRFGKLYALGADAYRMLPYMEQLQHLEGSHLNGLTGRLQIDLQGSVIRQLDWALIKDGTPRRAGR